ncbi:uncharacterized protein LOC127285375 [Leptopilina boulardi]|uniref:uncharacterized protein LOC127285375 n=1 Tax=Leptopilina boulardi TaxID=63433 RepID=UPI0021F5158E|nr:uncharacterized protein LOC127285375 [Leptopilina boulardi]
MYTVFPAKPRESNYIMGNLPTNRVSFSRPFLHIGVDFCGPFYTKEFRLRNRTKVKTYVSVFVCFATKAVHLELVNDLSTEAFISCLKRFCSRRGIPKTIKSNNGTNFVGADNELKTLFQKIDLTIKNEKVKDYLSDKGTTWTFNPPRAPHFGGLWEAAVNSFKKHFTRIAGTSLLSYEQLHTYVAEIEGILNSRPLTALSSDPNDFNPLSPAHFLIGSLMTSIPQEDLRSLPLNRLSAWRTIQQMRHHFWNRWHHEYLNEMISRSKWQSSTNQENIDIGTLVVIKDDNLPPMRWSLGRIVATHPGSDGIVRVVTIRSPTGTYKRALKKLYPLPIDD